MKKASSQLLNDLKEMTGEFISKAEEYKKLDMDTLNWKKDDKSWSVLECLEHLNLYGDFYLKEIEDKIVNTNHTIPSETFTSGLLGNYFAKSMLPKNGVITNKMKTFKDKDPKNSALEKTVIDRFVKQQKRMTELLEMAKKININKTRTGITITNLIRLKLGDTFRFVIYHEKRHMVQIEHILESVGV